MKETSGRDNDLMVTMENTVTTKKNFSTRLPENNWNTNGRPLRPNSF